MIDGTGHLTPPLQVTIRALQAFHAATHPAAANQPRRKRDGGEAKRIAVSGLLAALDEEAADEPGADQ